MGLTYLNECLPFLFTFVHSKFWWFYITPLRSAVKLYTRPVRNTFSMFKLTIRMQW